MSKLALTGTYTVKPVIQSLHDVCIAANKGKTFKIVQADHASEEGTILLISVLDSPDRIYPVELWPNPGVIWGTCGTVVDVDVGLTIT